MVNKQKMLGLRPAPTSLVKEYALIYLIAIILLLGTATFINLDKIGIQLITGFAVAIDTTDTDFSKGTLHLTNISGSGEEANVTLNFTTIDTFRVYNTSGNFTSQIFDTNSTTSVFDKIAWSRVLTNSSDVMGYAMQDSKDDIGVFYRNGSVAPDLTQLDLASDVDFSVNLIAYTLPSGWSYDDIVGFGWDTGAGGPGNDIYAFFKNGSVAGDRSHINHDTDITFTDITSTYAIPAGFNTSDIIGFAIDYNGNSAVFFKNKSFVEDPNNKDPPFSYTDHYSFTLLSEFDANDAIGIGYDLESDDIAMFFNNGSFVSDTDQISLASDMDFDDGVFRVTYPPGFANLTTYTNITLQTRVSNDSITFTAWSSNYTNPNGSENIEDNVARYIQYKAVLETPDKYITPYLQNVSINFTSGAAGADTTKPIINGTLNNTSPQQGFVVNATYNITDETALDNATIIINDTGFNRFFNFSLTGTIAQISQNFTVSCAAGCVINVTGRLNDTSGNSAQNETIITVSAPPDTTKPSIILDKPEDNHINDTNQFVNITFNGTATDDSALKNVTLYHNVSGTWKSNLTTSLSGTSSGFKFILNLTNTTFIWNVEACDTSDNCNFSTVNRTIILNFTAPLSISSFTPANESVNVSLKQDITAIFSQEMNKSTFTNSTVIIKDSDNNKVRGKIKYFTVSKKLRFNPHRFLNENITYIVNLTTGIKSEDGTSLDSDFIWNFTTEIKDTDKDGIPDIDDQDDDNDGIDDADDFLKGINASHIKTDIVGLSIKVNDSVNISKNLSSQNLVQLFANDTIIIEFNFSFGNASKLDLTNMTIQQNENSSKGSLIINSLTINNTQKTFYLDNLSTHEGVCVKDADVDSLEDISSSCNGTFEAFVECPGSAGNYDCSMNGTRFKITGLNHSAAQQSDDKTQQTGTEESSSGGSGSSGGGGGGGGAGGGGAGGGPLKVLNFTVDKNIIKVVLRQGQIKNETFSIKNTGTTVLDVIINLQDLEQFILSPNLKEINTMLNPNEEQSLNLVFGVEEELKPDVYTGEIKIKSGTIEKIINVIIEVESSMPLFDVDVEVLPKYKSILPGEETFIEVSLFSIRGIGSVNVTLEYSIKDFKGGEITFEMETVAVETPAKITKGLLVPSDLHPGAYVASVKVTYKDYVGIGSDIFDVEAKTIRLNPIGIKNNILYLLIGIMFVVSISLYLLNEFYPRKK